MFHTWGNNSQEYLIELRRLSKKRDSYIEAIQREATAPKVADLLEQFKSVFEKLNCLAQGNF